MWTDALLEWVAVSPSDKQSGNRVEVEVGSEVGRLYGLRLSIPYMYIRKIMRPTINEGQSGFPVFDLSLWAGEKEIFEHHKIIVGWTSPDELGVFLSFVPEKINIECIVDSTLSVLFDEGKRISGFLLHSFSQADKALIDQSGER